MLVQIIGILSLLNIFVSGVVSFNILAIVSIPYKSHYMALNSFFNELAIRGHTVTVLNNFPDANPVPNMTYVDLQAEKSLGSIKPLDYYEDMSYIHLHNIYNHVLHGPMVTEKDCENLFLSDNANSHLKQGKRYDVIFVEQFVSDCGLAYAEAYYDAPIIGITSHTLLPWAYPRLGIPFNIASDAFYFSNSGPNPSLYDKVESGMFYFLLNTWYKWLCFPSIYRALNKYLPNSAIDIEHLAKERMKMMFVYQHYSITGSRLSTPQVLEIGGTHIGKPKPVPEGIERFLSTASHGAIYFSFGTNLQINTMSKNKLQQFLDAFKKIPQKLLVKWGNGSFPAGNENVYTSQWMPQLDILCHPKVIAFISHGGMLSLSETAHCGKPVLTIPFFGDQFSNAAAARSVGLGKTIFFDKLNAQNLEEALRELTSPKMQENARKVSRMWHDRPQPVMDSAIFWTEYVARHRDAPPSLPSKHTTWFESLLLDVAFVIIAMLLVFVFIIYVIFKLLRMLLFKLLKSIYFIKLKVKIE